MAEPQNPAPPPMLCAICRRPLNAQTEAQDGRVLSTRYLHASVDRPDHDPVPMARDKMTSAVTICDFCFAPAADWAYPCRDFARDIGVKIERGRRVRQTVTSRGAWGACQQCHDDIEAGRWEKMVRRSAATQPAGTRNAYKRDTLELWRLFEANRTGEPILDYGAVWE